MWSKLLEASLLGGFFVFLAAIAAVIYEAASYGRYYVVFFVEIFL